MVNTTAYGYDAVGNLTSATDGNGHTSSSTYNLRYETLSVQPTATDPATAAATTDSQTTASAGTDFTKLMRAAAHSFHLESSTSNSNTYQR